MKKYLIILLLCVFFIPSVFAQVYGPRAFLTEKVVADFNTDGSYDTGESFLSGYCDSNPCRYGYLEASVPNNDDVLQNLEITLSSTANTNLQNETAFASVLTSYPTANSRKTVYVNTSWNDAGLYYNITSNDAAPVIELSLNYSNWAGGYDIFDADNLDTSTNTLLFNLSIHNPSTSKTLSSTEIKIEFALDTNGGADAVNIVSGTGQLLGGCTGTPTIDSRDGADGYNDRITASCDLSNGDTGYLVFNATLTEGTNIADGSNNIDTDSDADHGCTANYSQSSALTGITMSKKFARCSIRQGVDLAQDPGTNEWSVRGFIRNMANETPGTGEHYLTYNVSEWRIYQINPSTGEPYSNPNQTGAFNQTATSNQLTPSDGAVYTTDSSRSSNTSWFNTGSTTKPYFTVYFDWEVIWNSTNSESYSGYINTTLDLPTLYKIDMANTKSISGSIAPDTGGQTITIMDNTTHMGDSNALAKYIQILSVVPANTTAGNFHGAFDIDDSSVKVYFANSSGMYQLQNDTYFKYEVTDPASDGSSDGLVNVTIYDLSQVQFVSGGTVGHSLNPNEIIVLTYDCITNESMTTGDTYNFTGNTTMKTDSGTPLTEDHPTEQISVSEKRLVGYKDLIILDPSEPTIVNATIDVTVYAASGSNISGIKFTDYVPFGTDFNTNNVVVRFYDGSSWTTWTEGTDYTITEKGNVTLSDGKNVTAYEYINATGDGTWSLENNQTIEVKYAMNITTSGVYILPVEIAAFDPATGEHYYSRAFGVIRVDVPSPLLPLQITDSDLQQAKEVIIGKPALWIKNFEVYNPNARIVNSAFETLVFRDSIDVSAEYYDENGNKVEEKIKLDGEKDGKRIAQWQARINPLETRRYELRVLTPPVMEIDRDIDVLEKMPGKKVKLKMDIYLKNFAQEKYRNLVLNLPIGYENIFEVRDAFGNKLPFTGGKETSRIIIDEIQPLGMKTITVIYRASYPTIIITPDRDKYDLTSPVGLEVLVINGGEKIKYPYVEVEVYTPGMDVVYSDIKKLKDLEPLEKTELTEKFIIPANAPAGRYVTFAKFRQNFATLASTTGEFYVLGAGASTPEALQILTVLIITGVLVYFSFKRLKEVRRVQGGG